jgi:uncharacterized membrane protein required for colicin V production
MTPAILDIIVATIILLSMAIAFYRGIVKEIFTILGLAAATYGTYKGGHLLIPAFNKWLHVSADGGEKAAEAVSKGANADALSPAGMMAAAHKSSLLMGVISPAMAAKVCAYGSAFFGIFIIMALISYFLSRSVHEVGLGFVDRLLGAVFGFVRGFLLVFIPYVLCTFLIDEDKFADWAKNSMSVPILQSAFDYTDKNLELKQYIEKHGNSIALKIQKVDPDKIGKEVSKEEEELKNELSTDEKNKPAPSPAAPVVQTAPPAAGGAG